MDSLFDFLEDHPGIAFTAVMLINLFFWFVLIAGTALIVKAVFF